MVVSMEPMITVAGRRARRRAATASTTSWWSAEDGAENITKFPFGPEHNIVRA